VARGALILRRDVIDGGGELAVGEIEADAHRQRFGKFVCSGSIVAPGKPILRSSGFKCRKLSQETQERESRSGGGGRASNICEE
jgi:hypothetical protein